MFKTQDVPVLWNRSFGYFLNDAPPQSRVKRIPLPSQPLRPPKKIADEKGKFWISSDPGSATWKSQTIQHEAAVVPVPVFLTIRLKLAVDVRYGLEEKIIDTINECKNNVPIRNFLFQGRGCLS